VTALTGGMASTPIYSKALWLVLSVTIAATGQRERQRIGSAVPLRRQGARTLRAMPQTPHAPIHH
jgi:hypothetical protein